MGSLIFEARIDTKFGNEATNVNSELCSLCGGACCKRSGCHFSPKEFPRHSFKALKEYLDQGYISIGYGNVDLFSGENLILRMRNKSGSIYDLESFSEEPECALLTSTGCLLPYEKRPLGGQMLIPHPHHECRSIYTISECTLDWSRYRDSLRNLADYYKYMEKENYYENQLVKQLTKRK
jgi:hypothetical protein